MPRVTQHEQYKRHLFLRILWTDQFGQDVFGRLRAGGQWKVHTFYQPDEELNLADFKEHLRKVNQEQPQLRHVAGKLFHRLQDEFAASERRRQLKPETVDPIKRKTSGQLKYSNVVVYGIVRPKPDLHKLLQAARLMLQEEARIEKAAHDIEADVSASDEASDSK